MPEVHNRIRRLADRWGPAAWYGSLAVLVASPLFRGGSLLLLDVSLARRVPVQWWPSAAAPGPHNDAPADLMLAVFAKLGPAAGALLVLALFAGMGVAMHRATISILGPVRPAAAYFAGTLYAVNPFTYERLMHGHVYLLAAYAVAPLALAAFLRFLDAPGSRSGAALLAWTLVVSWTSIHLFVILVVAFGVAALFRRPAGGGILRWGAMFFVVWVALNAWWIAGVAVRSPGAAVGDADLLVFATRPASTSVVGHVAALYGFWRHEFGLPRDGVRHWWLLFIPIAGLAITGCFAGAAVRSRRWLAGWFVVAVPLAILLACGVSFKPTRGAFEWLFATLPGFKIFRESQKWVAILPLAYGLTGALGLDALLRRSPAVMNARQARGLILIALLVPLVYGRTLLANHERLTPSRFPRDWAIADAAVSRRPGTMLFLPWHLYISLSFTGRRVANPAPAYFSVPVLSGDNVEVGGVQTRSQDPRSELIEKALFTERDRRSFSETLTTLCISWVTLAKEDDFESYSWIRTTPDLRLVYEGPRLALFEVEAPLDCAHA